MREKNVISEPFHSTGRGCFPLAEPLWKIQNLGASFVNERSRPDQSASNRTKPPKDLRGHYYKFLFFFFWEDHTIKRDTVAYVFELPSAFHQLLLACGWRNVGCASLHHNVYGFTRLQSWNSAISVGLSAQKLPGDTFSIKFYPLVVHVVPPLTVFPRLQATAWPSARECGVILTAVIGFTHSCLLRHQRGVC